MLTTTVQSELIKEIERDLSNHHNENYPFEMCLLFAMAGLGFLGSALTFIIVLSQRHLRQMTSAFLLHGCVLDVVQCSFCIPFAIGLHKSSMQSICNSLGTSYIVLMTSSCFNLVAVICCEVYTYGDLPRCEHEDLHDEEKGPTQVKGSACCVIFGISIVYIGSIILHLGPTIIGGNFKIEENGSCLFIYNQDKNYVVFLMWIVIVTLAITATIYYLVIFYRTINRHTSAMTTTLMRSSISDSQRHQRLMRQRGHFLTSLNRAKVLTGAAVLHFLCWYPLFFLITVDPRFKVPVGLYEAFTILGWSNAAMEPLLLLVFDRQINLRIFRKILKRRPSPNACDFHNQPEIVPMATIGPSSSKNTINLDHSRFVGERLGSMTSFSEPTHPMNESQQFLSSSGGSVGNYSGRIIPPHIIASPRTEPRRLLELPIESSLIPRHSLNWDGSYCGEI